MLEVAEIVAEPDSVIPPVAVIPLSSAITATQFATISAEAVKALD